MTWLFRPYLILSALNQLRSLRLKRSETMALGWIYFAVSDVFYKIFYIKIVYCARFSHHFLLDGLRG